MNKDQIKGRIKEVADKLVSDKNIGEKGKVQTFIGNAQAGYGDLRNSLKKAGRNQLCMLNRHEHLRGFA